MLESKTKAIDNGMALLTTIGFIMVLTLLVLATGQTLLLFNKMSHRVELSHDAFYHLEKAVFNILASDIHPECIIDSEDINLNLDRVLNQHGCSLAIDGRPYVYLMDDLGVYPCLQIVDGNRIYSSHQWVISLATLEPRQMSLQLRMASRVKEESCSTLNVHHITEGLLSWRYLS